jgi:transposase
MDVAALLLLPSGLEIDRIGADVTVLTVSVTSVLPASVCPLCGMSARRIHSRYHRTVADVACGGRQVRLLLTVRKFFCDAPECARKIFTERLGPFLEPWARMTTRLAQALFDIGRATCGKLGARLAARLWMPTSWMTILRRIMAVPTPPVGLVSQLGLDDWSFLRRKQFGAILVNLETHRILDLLPDRSAPTAANWMQAHPEIELVSRDRSKEFATAVAQGAPQAVQVLDRFHLMQNLVEQIDIVVSRCVAELRRALPRPTSKPISTAPPAQWKPTPPPRIALRQDARQEARQARYEQVLALRQEGCNAVEIAERLGMKSRTVARWVRHFRQDNHRRKRPSAFDRFAPYVWERWQAGCHNGLRLWEELVALGYPGSNRSVYSYLQTLRAGFVPVFPEEPTPATPEVELPASQPPQPARLDAFTLTQMKWFLVHTPADLEEPEIEHLTWLCQSHGTLATLYGLVQRFRRLLRERQGEALDGWIADCQASGIPELAQFATGLVREYDWVVAGITHPASNGPTEGANTKLKLIKRVMYGRAGFPLLRHRVLHAL